MKINHVLIQTTDLDSMTRFLNQVTGLKEGYRPPFPFSGVWIYSDDKPIFHLVENSPNSSQSEYLGSNQSNDGVGVFDHVALEGANYSELIKRLTNHGIKYIERSVPISKQHQVFVFGPDDVKLELMFNEDKSELTNYNNKTKEQEMSNSSLFSPKTFGRNTAKNRIVMAPMTRSRSKQPGDIPTDLMAEYYAQRASAGFIVTEATQISQQGKGYSFTPGIYSEEQVEGWKKTTQAVHEKGGTIFLQLWHVGRMSHESFHEDGIPVAPSALAPDAQVWVVDEHGQGHMVDCPVPRALSKNEIMDVLVDYKVAAKNAMEAGFDGVEIHGGNGYLIDQFLRQTSNKRTDEYGGNIENRLRFPLEVVQAISDEIGSDKVGIRLAPFITQRGMNDIAAIPAILRAAELMNQLKIAYIHLSEADWDDAPTVSLDFRKKLRQVFDGAIIVAGNYTADTGAQIIDDGLVDFVAYGRKFLANPDLPHRFKNSLSLNEIEDMSTLFGGDEKGYTDYPSSDS